MEDSFSYFTASKSQFNIFNYDLHMSFNEGLYQVLIVIELLERGINNGFKTFTNLPIQALPSLLDGILYQRPISDSQVLQDLEIDGLDQVVVFYFKQIFSGTQDG